MTEDEEKAPVPKRALNTKNGTLVSRDPVPMERAPKAAEPAINTYSVRVIRVIVQFYMLEDGTH